MESDMPLYRKNGLEALATCLSNKRNIEILEREIHEKCKDIEKYNDFLFQTIGEITSGRKLSEIRKDIKAGYIGWNSPAFSEIRAEQKEDDEFIENPFEVVEGILKCGKCGSKRTVSYSKQTRAADEPATTIATCVVCKHTWRT